MKVCLYIRLSESDEDIKIKSESDSISNQRVLLTQYLKRHSEFYPYEIVEFVDDGFSGTNGNRPAFERMIRFLYDGGAKLVLCKDLSRFFRNYVEIGDYLERIFPTLGVRLIAVNDGYDSDDYKGTTGGLDVVMRCIVYAAYSRDISQKTKSAKAMRIRKGQFIAANPPYGYLRDPEDKHHLIPDPTVRNVICRIFDLACAGKTTSEIANILNNEHVEPPAAHYQRLQPGSINFQKTTVLHVWDTHKVVRILKRQEYTGALVSGKSTGCKMDGRRVKPKEEWITIPDCHEAIISAETFQKAQTIIQKYKKRNSEAHDYLLRTLVHCGCCGLTMRRAIGKSGNNPYYRCRNLYDENIPCPHGEHFPEAELERLIIQSLSQLLQITVDQEKRIREAAARMQGTAENLHREVDRAEKAIQKLFIEKLEAYERYADGRISRDTFQTIRLQIVAETETLQQKKESLEQKLAEMQQAESPSASRAVEEAESFLKAENITNEMLLHFIERVDVYSGMRVEITYRFRNPFDAVTKPEGPSALPTELLSDK